MRSVEVLTAARKLQLLNAPQTDVMFHGTSMEPLLREGDRIILEKVDFGDIRIGDIITSIYEDKYPTRRVVFKKKDRIKVWCESRPKRVFNIKMNEVLGRVVSRKRNGEVLTNTDTEWVQLSKKALQKYRSRQINGYYKRILQLIFRK